MLTAHNKGQHELESFAKETDNPIAEAIARGFVLTNHNKGLDELERFANRGNTITEMTTLAEETGIELSRPILEKNYTLVTCDDFYKDEDEYNQDILEYGSIFKLERIKPSKPATAVTRILKMIKDKKLDPNTVMVQLPKAFSEMKYRAELKRLVGQARGIKFMIIDTNVDNQSLKDDENSSTYRRNIYSMMLLGRHIDENTLVGSKLHTLLNFLIGSILGDDNQALISGYMDALMKNDVTLLARTVLSYKPMIKYDAREEYHNISYTLIMA